MVQRAIKSEDLMNCVQHLTSALRYSQDVRSVVEKNVERALNKLFATPQDWDEPGVVINGEIQVGSSHVADAILKRLENNTEGGCFESLKSIKEGIDDLQGALIDFVDGVNVPKLRGIADDLSAVKGQFDNTNETTLSAEVSSIKTLISQKDIGLIDKIVGIESKVEDIPLIKQSTYKIESEVLSNVNGLEKIRQTADSCYSTLAKNTSGLETIETKVSGLDTLLQDSTYGLNKLKELIDSISSSLSNSVFGLKAINDAVGSNSTLIKLLPTKTTLESELSEVMANDNANKKAITDLVMTTEKDYLLQTQNTLREQFLSLWNRFHKLRVTA